jgi:hypothetical protein
MPRESEIIPTAMYIILLGLLVGMFLLKLYTLWDGLIKPILSII